VTDPTILARVTVAEDETIVEVPAKLMTHLAKDGLSGRVVNVVPPIVTVTAEGNYIVQGASVLDVETLGQMDIPEHETSVEVTRPAMVGLVEG
jgi:hypothetical protein